MTAVLEPRRKSLPVLPRLPAWSVLPALAALSVALRISSFSRPLGIDEGGDAFIAHAWGHGSGSLYGAYWLDRPPLLLALFKVAVLGGTRGIYVLGTVCALCLVFAGYGLAQLLAGSRAAWVTGLLLAVMASSAAVASDTTQAELVASAPAALSVLCLVLARRRGDRWLLAAGVLAACALLIKQSFLDAGFAGFVFLVATRRVRPWLWYGGGVAVPLGIVAAWLLIAHEAARAWYAWFGFRVDGLRMLSHTGVSLSSRLDNLVTPAWQVGLIAAAVTVPFGLWRLRTDRVMCATILAWLVACAVGVLGGGSYWPHYLIQLLAPVALLAGVALAGVHVGARFVAAAAIAAVALAFGLQHGRSRSIDLQVARYVRTHAAPGDTQYVMYAHADVDYYTGLPSPFPYEWSLMMRAIPGADARLVHTPRSPSRPTWIIGWQAPSRWHLDPHHAIARVLARDYRVVTRIHGHPIYHMT